MELDRNDTSKPSGAAPQRAESVQIARRKAILRGLGKTAAIAGAATPLSSLATQRLRIDKSDGKSYHCCVSGHMSVMMSAGHDHVPVCHGKKPSIYCSKDKQCNNTTANKSKHNWPQWPNDGTQACVRTAASGGTAYTPNAQFSQVFKGGSATMMGALLNTAATSDEAHWVTALLNANKNPSTFPHKPEEVLKHYTEQRDVALKFYKLVNVGT